MPPETVVSMPTDMGESAYRYLRHHGIEAVVPHGRSGDYGLCRSNPRLYYIIRRLGLVPAMRWSEALNRGSWFHILFAHYDHPDRLKIYETLVDLRMEELRATCTAFKISDEKRAIIIQRETLDAVSARAWFEATEYVEIIDPNTSQNWGTFQEWLRNPRWRKLGEEVLLSRTHPDYPEMPLVAQFDALLYEQSANELWVVDPKTCSETTIQRMTTCTYEHQTRQYLTLAQWALDTGLMQKRFDLPADCTLGGMVHVPIWKPGIRFGMKDRPFQWHSIGKRRKAHGILYHPSDKPDLWKSAWAHESIPITEVTAHSGTQGTYMHCYAALHEATGKKPEKVYMGEPDPNRFVDRLKDCYLGEGDYLAEAEERRLNPPVNMSFTSATIMHDKDWLTEYYDCVDYVYSHATRDPFPGNFLPPDLRDVRGKEYAPFFTNPPAQWPEIIAKNHFITARRESDVNLSEATILS